MAFLVLVQGYELIGGPGIGFAVKLGMALLVGMTTLGVAYGFEGRLGVAGVGGGRVEEVSQVDEGDEASDEVENGKGRV